MNAITLSVAEAEPEERPLVMTWPRIPANAYSAIAVWQRLEAWIAWRWGERAVIWRVEGPGAWAPTLRPATIATVERWTGAGWEAATPPPTAAGGYELPAGDYRITGTVGSADAPPAAVAEAFRRLADHFAAIRVHSPMLGSSRHEQSTGEARIAIERSPSWAAKAIHNSGAADLLRAYRRP